MTEIRESALHCLTEIRNKIADTRYTPWLKYGWRLFYTENILHLMIKIHFCGSCIVMLIALFFFSRRFMKWNATILIVFFNHHELTKIGPKSSTIL